MHQHRTLIHPVSIRLACALLGFSIACIVWLVAFDARAAQTRRVAVVDEAGNPVAVEVKIAGRPSTIIDPECEVLTGNAKQTCKATSAPEFRLQVRAGKQGADIYGRVSFDSKQGMIELVSHPQAQKRCFDVSLHVHGSNFDPAYFGPRTDDSTIERSLCGVEETHYVVDRREQQVEIEISGNTSAENFRIKPDSAYQVTDLAIELPTITFTLRFARRPNPDEKVMIELLSDKHHPVIAQVLRTELMRRDHGWTRVLAAPTVIFEALRLELSEDTKTQQLEPEQLLACVKYPRPAQPYLVEGVMQIRDALAQTSSAEQAENLAASEDEPSSNSPESPAAPDPCAAITDKLQQKKCRSDRKRIEEQREAYAAEHASLESASDADPSDMTMGESEGEAAPVPEGVCRIDTCGPNGELCQPCLDIQESNGSLEAMCPLWREAGTNQVVLYERPNHSAGAKPRYDDQLECTPEAGRCAFKRYFEQPHAKQILLRFHLETLTRLELGNRAYLTVERILPSGAIEVTQLELGLYRQAADYRDDGTVVIDASAFANDSPEDRYNLRVHAVYSNYPRNRSALRLATGIDRAALMTLTHDASALGFPRTGISVRAYSGVSLVVPRQDIAQRSDKEYSLGADPFLGLGLVPEFYLRRARRVSIPLQVVLGVEAEPVREWYVPVVGSPTSTPKWRSRVIVGLGVRSRPIPWLLRAAFELQLAWAPEVPGRGQALNLEQQLGIAMIGVHASYDLLPRFSDRMRLFIGADTYIGSRTLFEFEDAESSQANARIHVSFGIVMSFDSRYRPGQG